jgi:leucyl/phenylalanyl-tRNA--protein transferase
LAERLIWLDPDDPTFPPSECALTEPDGLLAVGGDLSPTRLINAYHRGIFPWYESGQPILWWTPDPRMVLFPAECHISRSLRKVLRKKPFKLTADTAFDAVMDACAAPRQGVAGTWITREMKQAYQKLHQLGYAHSIEAWEGNQLVGGLYGVAMGGVFFGESMFSRRTNASKVVFTTLARTLQAWNFQLLDCQVASAHLFTLGAREIPRADFETILENDVSKTVGPVNWQTAWQQTNEAEWS